MGINFGKNYSICLFLAIFFAFAMAEIFSVKENDCLIIRHLNSIFGDSDRCVVIFYDSNDISNCPLSFNMTRSVRVSHDAIVSGTAFHYQNLFECKRYLIGTYNISHFQDIFSKNNNAVRFLPFTKIIIFNSSSAEEVTLTNQQITFAYFNGLYMISAFLDSEKTLNLVNLMTNQRTKGPDTALENVYNRSHPLFEGRFYPREINISLFHCPPFVIINKNNQTNETTFDGVEYNLVSSITKGWRKGITIRYFDDHKVGRYARIN